MDVTPIRLRPTRPGTKGPRRRERPQRGERPERRTAPEEAPPLPELFDERRLREAGGPDDRAMYSCGCGYVFRADVSTSVACPHCGATQAW